MTCYKCKKKLNDEEIYLCDECRTKPKKKKSKSKKKKSKKPSYISHEDNREREHDVHGRGYDHYHGDPGEG